jgi:hypothetical protein
MNSDLKYRDLTKTDLSFVIDEYNSLYFEIMDILYKINPIPFISNESRNEYAPEARTLSVKIHFAKSVEELERIIKVDFEQWFDKELVEMFNKFSVLAKQLLPLVRSELSTEFNQKIK